MGLKWSSMKEKHGRMAWRDADSVGRGKLGIQLK